MRIATAPLPTYTPSRPVVLRFRCLGDPTHGGEETPRMMASLKGPDGDVVDAYSEELDGKRGWLTRIMLKRIAGYQRRNRVRVKNGEIRFEKPGLLAMIPWKWKGWKLVRKDKEDYYTIIKTDFPDGKILGKPRGAILTVRAGGDSCAFFPSCSSYGAEAIRKFGPIRGVFKTWYRMYVMCQREFVRKLRQTEGTRFVADGPEKGKIFDPP